MSPNMRAGGPGSQPIEPKRWSWDGALSSAYDWGHGGALVGGATLCGVGAVPGGALGSTLGPGGTLAGAGVGCVMSAPAGVFWGAVIGAPIGFVLGGLGVRGEGAFSWGPDQLITPW